MKRTTFSGALLAAILLLCAACGSALGHPTEQVGQVSLGVSGGIAGWIRQVSVDEDGMAHLSVTAGPKPAAGTHAVPAETLTRLRSLIGDPAFAHLAHEYPAPPGAADLQTYVLTAEVDGRQIEIVTYDSVDVPAVLRDALTLMIQILESFGSVAA